MSDQVIHGRATSITVRLAATIALILAAGGIGISVAAYAYGRQAAQEAYDRMLAGAAFQIVQAVSIIDGRVVVNLPVSAFELLALAPDDRVFYRIVGPDGGTITGYDGLPPPAAQGDEMTFYSTDYSGETVRLASAVRRFAERGFAGEVQIVVGHTTRARAALAWDITAKALALLAIAGVALVALVAFAVRSSLGPLVRIEQALRARDPKDLSPLTVSTPREVETIVAAINRFMGRLADRVTIMQNLIADATHQLEDADRRRARAGGAGERRAGRCPPAHHRRAHPHPRGRLEPPRGPAAEPGADHPPLGCRAAGADRPARGRDPRHRRDRPRPAVERARPASRLAGASGAGARRRAEPGRGDQEFAQQRIALRRAAGCLLGRARSRDWHGCLHRH
jgi:hypothetical protein